MRYLYLGAILTLLCLHCTQQSDSQFDKQQITGEVEAMFEAYFDTTQDGGIQAGFTFLDTSQQFFWVPPGYKSAIGYDSVIAVLTAVAPSVASVKNKWLELTIHPLDNDYATFTGRIHSRMSDTSGVTTHTQLLESGVVVRRRSGWKMLCGQTRVVE